MTRNERSDDNDGGFNRGSAEFAGSELFRASIKTVVKDDAPSTEHRAPSTEHRVRGKKHEARLEEG